MFHHKKPLLFTFYKANPKDSKHSAVPTANLVVEWISEAKSLGSEPGAACCPMVFPL